MHGAESRRGLNPEFPTGVWNVETFPGTMWDNEHEHKILLLLFSRSVVSDSLGPRGMHHANQQSSPKPSYPEFLLELRYIDLNGHPHCWLQCLAPLEVSLVPHDPKPPPWEPHCWTVAIRHSDHTQHFKGSEVTSQGEKPDLPLGMVNSLPHTEVTLSHPFFPFYLIFLSLPSSFPHIF